jgi:hypothetical protein
MSEQKNAPKHAIREPRSGRFVEIGGTAVKVATPVTSLPNKKQAEIRSAVRDFYAGKKGK